MNDRGRREVPVKYSDERKEAVLKKLLPPHNRTVAQLADEEGISAATLYNWRRKAREQGRLLPDSSPEPEGWSSRDKFNAVLETAPLSEAEVAEYCRRRGLYPEQLQRWRASCEQANDAVDASARQEREQVRTERQRSKELEKELKRKESALAETAALLTLRKKGERDLGGRGRMTSAPDREQGIKLVDEARAEGARLAPACVELGIGLNTYRRWKTGGVDGRRHAVRPPPSNALTEAERDEVLAVCHRPAWASLPPGQIVPRLLDEEDRYLASESTFYRLLRAAGEQQRRGRAAAPHNPGPPRRHTATGPNQLWSWDVTYLPTRIRGQFFYLYLIIDLFSRKVTGFEVFGTESAANSRTVIERAVLREGVAHRPLVLHADNGSAMKGATLCARLEELGVTRSHSRPRISNDNAYSEALFRTAKYRPSYPPDGFDDLEAARQWVLDFVHWYNHEHRHSAIQYVTPAERHRGRDRHLLARRKHRYEEARAAKPGRWGGRPVRDWTPVEAVHLNPEPALEAA
nr:MULTISPECIES: IS3 family transposase [unclassified Thioalkalivibrio]